jgi:hypothetical protein
MFPGHHHNIHREAIIEHMDFNVPNWKRSPINFFGGEIEQNYIAQARKTKKLNIQTI